MHGPEAHVTVKQSASWTHSQHGRNTLSASNNARIEVEPGRVTPVGCFHGLGGPQMQRAGWCFASRENTSLLKASADRPTVEQDPRARAKTPRSLFPTPNGRKNGIPRQA